MFHSLLVVVTVEMSKEQKRPVKRKAEQPQAPSADAAAQHQKTPRLLGKEEVVRALQNTEITNASQFERDLERRFIAFLTDLELLDTYRHQKRNADAAAASKHTREQETT
jgi:hypothetical protein